MIRVELEQPELANAFFPGMQTTVEDKGQRWYEKLLYLFRRYVMRKRDVITLTVTSVDHENGTIELEGDE